MNYKGFQHFMSFGISGVNVPAKRIEKLFSARLQADVLGEVLKEKNPAFMAPSLQELREPDLGKVNYAGNVRGLIQALWQPIVEDPSAVPPPQLLERLNRTWSGAEEKIGQEVQNNSRAIFSKRAAGKAEIIKERAHRMATEQGIPGTIVWLEGLMDECEQATKAIGKDVLNYTKRKERQAAVLEELKKDWNHFLSKATEVGVEPLQVARNFLIMAGFVMLTGLGLWILCIPLNSLLGVVGAVISVLIALKISWPLFRYLHVSMGKRLLCTRLASAYKTMSLFGLDEITKRLELEYYAESLPAYIKKLSTAFQGRQVELERRTVSLKERIKALKESLHTASATVRTVVRDSALDEWYARGKSQAPKNVWQDTLCSIDAEPSWEEMGEQARIPFEFLQGVKIEDEVFNAYRERDERLGFLVSLKEAAIGRTPGEALLSVDFSLPGERPMENYLIIEIFDPEHSALARELQDAWGDAVVGLSIVPAADASAISFIGISYGFPFESIKDYNPAMTAFELAKKEEGQAIYPVLYPKVAAA